MSGRAFERGAARARYCKAAFAQRGIVIGAPNPYKRPAQAAARAAGFSSEWGKGARNG